jgi:hypothetical protein
MAITPEFGAPIMIVFIRHPIIDCVVREIWVFFATVKLDLKSSDPMAVWFLSEFRLLQEISWSRKPSGLEVQETDGWGTLCVVLRRNHADT